MYYTDNSSINSKEIISYVENGLDAVRAAGHVIVSEKMTNVRKGLFEGNNNITSVTVTGSTKVIGDNAFKGCKNLRTVELADSVEEIGSGSFSDCPCLTSIILPDSIKVCKKNAFKNSALKEPVLNKSGTVLYFYPDTDSDEEASVPKTVKTITPFAFNQNSMNSVYLQEGLESIHENAFYECHNLKDITIPASTRIIKSNAFYYCNHLERITVLGSTTIIEKAAFNLCVSRYIEFNIDIIDSDKKFSFLNMTFLTKNTNECGNLDHVSSPEFIRLTEDIEKGNIDSMYELSCYFKVLSMLPDASPFYHRASNYWMYRAYKKGHPKAREYIRWYFLIHPDKQLNSIMSEDETIDNYSYTISARILYELGYLFFKHFDPSSKWEVKYREKEMVVEASTFRFQEHIAGEYTSDYYYEWWFLDEYFRPIPNVKQCTSTFRDKDRGLVHYRHMQAVEYVKNRIQ